MRNYLFAILSLFIIESCTIPDSQISYSINSDWLFSNSNDTIWYPATVPGVIHTDLLTNNLIEDPYWESNELKQQWIEKENWIYRTQILIDDHLIKQDNIELEFNGLDTYATVFVNGTKVIKADNMFRTWKVNIKNIVKVGQNTIEVQFISPVNFNKDKVEEYPHKLPSGNETVELKVSPFTRKAAYHFGWDWAPRFVTSGIWKDVKINSWNNARIVDVFVATDSIVDDKAYLTYHLKIESQNTDLESHTLFFNDKEIEKTLAVGINHIKYQITISMPHLWWPNGMGEPNLNELTVQLKHRGNILDQTTQKYGIRTVELVQDKDSIGTSFYFEVNGEPLFMKGANYIPQDMFLPRVSDNQYIDLISKVADANMNMLRVWGGGIYENDLFYDLCDENGILVWQDFMFTGSLYPNDSAFLENVKQEAIENVIRLRKHPSIALWCGNNEIEVAWGNWGWQKQYGYTPKDSVEIWDNYKYMFQSLLPEIVKEFNSEVNYVSTSPLSNWGKSENFNNSSMHYWGVWHGREPFEKFKTNVGRFMVEYGFQSFPSIETLHKFALDSSFTLTSSTMLNRQKSYIGNGLIIRHINNWFEAPTSFTDFVEKSQKNQAIGIQIAIQAHRHQSPHCMGSLFWQLNDCWPGPSWSVIDYYGHIKIAYETVKQNYKPIIAILDVEHKEVEIISDLESDFNGRIELLDETRIIYTKGVVVKANSRLKIDLSTFILSINVLSISIKDSNDEVVYEDLVHMKSR